jgi:hypothetical protein
VFQRNKEFLANKLSSATQRVETWKVGRVSDVYRTSLSDWEAHVI